MEANQCLSHPYSQSEAAMQIPGSQTETAPASEQGRDTTRQVYEEQVSKLYAATSQILSNLRYICDELPNIPTTAETRDAILKVCDDFQWEVLDIRMEIRRLEDNLGLHPGEDPFQHGMESQDPRETMRFIHDWLGPQLRAMHDLVTRAHAQAEHHPEAALLAILLAESASNIIHAAIAIRDALDVITTTLNQGLPQVLHPRLRAPQLYRRPEGEESGGGQGIC
jgi:hypothetical protein